MKYYIVITSLKQIMKIGAFALLVTIPYAPASAEECGVPPYCGAGMRCCGIEQPAPVNQEAPFKEPVTVPDVHHQ